MQEVFAAQPELENLLLAEKGNLDSIRIADFGLANELDISNTLKSY